MRELHAFKHSHAGQSKKPGPALAGGIDINNIGAIDHFTPGAQTVLLMACQHDFRGQVELLLSQGRRTPGIQGGAVQTRLQGLPQPGQRALPCCGQLAPETSQCLFEKRNYLGSPVGDHAFHIPHVHGQQAEGLCIVIGGQPVNVLPERSLCHSGKPLDHELGRGDEAVTSRRVVCRLGSAQRHCDLERSALNVQAGVLLRQCFGKGLCHCLLESRQWSEIVTCKAAQHIKAAEVIGRQWE